MATVLKFLRRVQWPKSRLVEWVKSPMYPLIAPVAEAVAAVAAAAVLAAERVADPVAVSRKFVALAGWWGICIPHLFIL